MTETKLDPRLNPYRPDLAAEHLRGRVAAERFTAGQHWQVTASHLPLRRSPQADAPLDTEALFGETVTLYDIRDGWGWGQLDNDGYVGYLPMEGLSTEVIQPTHRVSALRTYVYPAPDIKSPPLTQLSLNAVISAKSEEGAFLSLSGGGYVFARHAARCDRTGGDFVAVAETFLNTPYLWGGRTSLGLDCSGLVQLSLQAAGFEAPRDTDMQATNLGEIVEEDALLRRGDLVFWPGHVGIMTSAETLLHANAHHMAVASELLQTARDRIAVAGHAVSCVKRIVA